MKMKNSLLLWFLLKEIFFFKNVLINVHKAAFGEEAFKFWEFVRNEDDISKIVLKSKFWAWRAIKF